MVTAADLTPLHVDALRELANVCGGRAADALSRLLGERPVGLDLSVAEKPRGSVAERVGGPEASVVAAKVDLAGPVKGELWLVLRERDAAVLSGLLDHDAKAQVAPWALYEAANIVASACLNALYAMTQLTVVPSVPEVLQGAAKDVLRKLGLEAGVDAPLLTTELQVRDAAVRGRIVFVPHEESVELILKAMGLH